MENEMIEKHRAALLECNLELLRKRGITDRDRIAYTEGYLNGFSDSLHITRKYDDASPLETSPSPVDSGKFLKVIGEVP